MSALMSDVLDGTVTPGVCNAAVNAGGKLLKVVEMQIRYGIADRNGRRLILTGEPDLVAVPPPTNGAVRMPKAKAAS
jgi:hypothetical protein